MEYDCNQKVTTDRFHYTYVHIHDYAVCVCVLKGGVHFDVLDYIWRSMELVPSQVNTVAMEGCLQFLAALSTKNKNGIKEM